MSHWPRLPVSAVCEIVKGGVDPQRYTAELFAHYSIPALDEGDGPAIEVGDAIKSQKTVIENQVVLVSKLNPRIPRVWLVDDDQACRRICSTEFVPLKPDPARLDLAYLAFAMRFALADGQISGSTSAATKSRERAKPNDLLRLTLPLPPLSEQRRIVDLLARAEGIVRLRREAEQKAAELIPALFLDMFGDPATNPKGWPVKRLDSLCDLVRGSSPRPQGDPRFFGGPVPRLMIADITRDGVYVKPAIDSLTVEGAKKSRPMNKGEVVMAVSGAVGLPAILAIDACIHDGFVGFRSLDRAVSPEFFYNFLAAFRRHSIGQAVGATFQNLKTDQIREWIVPIPPPDLQSRFQKTANDLRGLEAQQAAATAKTIETFDALLGQVFSQTAGESL